MKFYILDARTVVGNCALWWCPNGSGYTTQLEEAGLYEEADAKERRRDTDIAIPEEIAKKCAVSHVRVERLRDAMEQAALKMKMPPGKRVRR